MSNLITKEYIEREYHLAMLDLKTAKNEDEQWEARKTMARLEQIAAQEFGFTYADELHAKELKEVDTHQAFQDLAEELEQACGDWQQRPDDPELTARNMAAAMELEKEKGNP